MRYGKNEIDPQNVPEKQHCKTDRLEIIAEIFAIILNQWH